MRQFQRFLAIAAFAVAAAFVNSGSAVAAPASSGTQYGTEVADLEFDIRHRSDSRVCCKRGYRDWWSTYRQCRRSGGYVTRNRECRDGRVGYRAYRVCCKRGHRDWWSTARQCRRSGGHIVANRACRWN